MMNHIVELRSTSKKKGGGARRGSNFGPNVKKPRPYTTWAKKGRSWPPGPPPPPRAAHDVGLSVTPCAVLIGDMKLEGQEGSAGFWHVFSVDIVARPAWWELSLRVPVRSTIRLTRGTLLSRRSRGQTQGPRLHQDGWARRSQNDWGKAGARSTCVYVPNEDTTGTVTIPWPPVPCAYWWAVRADIYSQLIILTAHTSSKDRTMGTHCLLA